MKLTFNRYTSLGILFGVFFFAIFVRMFYLQVASHASYAAQAREQHFGSIKIPAKRGEILVQDPRSKEYYKLATNITLDLLYVDPFMVTNERETASKLAPFVLQTLCSDKKDLECEEAVKKHLQQTELTNPENENQKITREMLQSKIEQWIYEKISQKEVKTVALKKFYGEKESFENIRNQIAGMNINGISVDDTGIYADPTKIRDPEIVSEQIANLLDFSEDDLTAKLSRRILRYAPLVNKIQPTVSDSIKSLELPGVVILAEHWRFYPENTLAAQVVGFLDSANVGQYGIEGKFDSLLRGIEGEIQSENDLLGRNLVIKEGSIKNAKDGASVVLTIDRVIQAEVEKRLSKAVDDYRANSGQVVVMDPFSGEVIAMAHYPMFNPNTYSDVYKQKEISFDPGKSMTVIKELDNNKYLTYENKFGPGVYINQAVSSLYEPGSIFKPFTVAAGVDSGEITPRTTYYDNGELMVDEYTIHNVSEKCLGRNDMTHALNYSCNIGMASIAKKLGKSLFYHYILRFGFGERTDVELDAEEKGFVRYYRNWAASNLATISFGQGISVTPLQITSAFASFANGGLLIEPRIIREIIYPDGKKEASTLEIVRRVISKETADTLTAMLISSVERGVAGKGKLPHYFIAGKTGTAQIALQNGQGFEEGEGSTTASFIGYAPATNPKFVMLVKIDRPRSSEWADQTAALLFHDLSEFLVQYYNLPPDK